MKNIITLLLVCFFCFCTTALSQFSENINYTKRFAEVNAIIPDFQVNDDQGGLYPSISVDTNGNFVITWFYGDVYAQRYSSEGTALGSNFKVNDNQEGGWPSCVSTDDSGNFVITWGADMIGYGDIYAQRYSNDGTALGSNFKVNDNLGLSMQRKPFISTDASGSFVIAWTDGRNDSSDVYAQCYSSDGTAFGSNFKVNDVAGVFWNYSGPPHPSICTGDNGNFVIAWTDERSNDDNIYAQRYSSDGTAMGSNFKVNDDLGINPQWSSYISTDGSGNFVITWSDGRNDIADIYAQRYSSDGTALGSNFKVNNDQGNERQYDPSISTDSIGNFVITWGDDGNGDPDIYAQRYTSDGNTLGNNFIVTNISDSSQGSPDVKLWNGRIYNTWVDNRALGSYGDIWANVLDWNNPVGVEDEETLEIPLAFSLSQNYPNPFNPSTKIKYSVSQSSNVVIKVFDVLGNEIETLVNKEKPIGTYELTWNAEQLPGGVYFYRLQAGDFIETKKMLLLK